MTDIVLQTTPWNCGSAVLAMVLGLKTCEEVEELLGRKVSQMHMDIRAHPKIPGEEMFTKTPYLGVSTAEMSKVLFEQGVAHHVWAPAENYDEGSVTRVFFDKLCAYNIEEAAGFLEEHRGILGVLSKNNEGGNHYVYMEAGEIYDPANPTLILPGKEKGMERYMTGDSMSVFIAVLMHRRE